MPLKCEKRGVHRLGQANVPVFPLGEHWIWGSILSCLDLCHPSAPGMGIGDHPAIPPVPGLLHPLSQPAFLLGIKQAG